MIAGFYRVKIRRGGRWPAVRPEAQQLEGNVYRFREGWQLTHECEGRYAGEPAMVGEWRDAAHPYPPDAPAWIAFGDLEPVDALVRGDLVEQAK